MKLPSFSILGAYCLVILGLAACSTSEAGDDASDDDAMSDDDTTSDIDGGTDDDDVPSEDDDATDDDMPSEDDDATDDDDDTSPLDAGSSDADAGDGPDDGTPPLADGGALPEDSVDGGTDAGGGNEASKMDGGGDDGETPELTTDDGGPYEALWEETFENGFGDWFVEGGNWAIGVPAPITAARPAAFEGDNLASTGLTENYETDADSRLISPVLTIPEAETRPRLRFQVSHSFWSTDYGQLQVREVDGEWQDLVTFTGVDTLWNQRLVDLSALAGKQVEFAFRLVTGAAGGGTNTGLLIDHVVLEQGRLTFDNPVDFENGFGDWSVEGGDWAIGVPAPVTMSRPEAHGGEGVASTGLITNYETERDARLISPEFLVPDAELRPTLRYWAAFTFWSDDYAEVQIRPLGGEWASVPDGEFTGTSPAWAQKRIDLRPYAGSLVQIGFRLVTGTSGGGTNTGLFIDDISVETD